MKTLRSLALVGVSVVGSGCSHSPPVDVSATLETMVAYEATFQCEVTRFAFVDLGDVDAVRARVREQFGVTQVDVEQFRAAVAQDAELRGAVLDQYALRCGGGE